MANNAGAPQQQLMYYYVAVQNPQAPQGYGQGGDGMNHQDFSQGQPGGMPEFQNQQAYFMAPAPDGSNMGAVGMQMGHMPVMQGQVGQQGVMMPGGPGGQMMMLMTPGQQMQGQMMPNQQMVQPNQMQGQMGQGQQQQPPPQQMEPPAQDNQQRSQGWGGPAMAPQQSHDNSQGQGRTPGGGASKALRIVNPGTGEEITGKGNETGSQGPMSGQQMQANAMPWQQQDARQASQSQSMTKLPQQSSQPQTFVPSGGQTGPEPSSQGQPPAPAPATKVKKGLQNKKIEKNKADETPSSSAPASTPQAETPKAPSPMPPSRNVNSTEGTTAAAKSSTGPAPSESKASSIPKWPPGHQPPDRGQSSHFASSIKALNLEPMRANPTQRTKPAVARSAVPEPLPPAPSQQNQNQAQNNSQQQAPPQQQPQPQPQPQPQQTQQPPPQPQQMQPQMQMQPNFQQQMPVMQMMPQQMPQQMQQMPHMQVNNGTWPQHQSPAPSPTPKAVAPVAPVKKVNKLKNAVLARPKREGEEDDRSEATMKHESSTGKDSSREKDDSSATKEKIIGMSDEVCASCGSFFAVDALFCRKCGSKRPSSIEAPPPAAKAEFRPPRNGIFDRQLMLRIWRVHKDIKHEKVQDLKTSARAAATPVGKNIKPGGGGGGVSSRLKPSENAYQRREPTTREQEIERQVRSLLNKICPENLKTIVERLAQVELHTANELEFVIRIIFEKALLEPHYCETYADMVFALQSRYPQFPPENEGEKPHTFTRVLLNICQNEFESLPTTFEATEEDKVKFKDDDHGLFLVLKKRKDKMLANMKFIGNLFLRQLLAVKVIGQVVYDLVGIKDNSQYPEEHMIECVCELLKAIGHTLEQTTHGKTLMEQFTQRMKDLKRSPTDGSQPYSKRIIYKIQDLLDLRHNNWQQKMFREQAMTKDQVKKAAKMEERQAARGVDVTFSTQTVGVRPSYIDEFKVAPKPRTAPVKEERKAVWDQPHVKRCFHYFIEDKNAEGLVSEWKRPAPSSDQKKDGVSWLCDIGLNDSNKEEMVAETLLELLQRGGIDWIHLQEALAPSIEDLENITLDTPNAPKFVHSLFSKLFLTFKNNFQSSILSIFKSCSSKDLVATVLVGILRKVHAKAGSDGVNKVLKDQAEFVSLLSQAKGIKKEQLSQALATEGLL